jgi:hypothetical protein
MSTAHWQVTRLPIPAAWPVRSSPAPHPWAIVSAGLAPILLTGTYLMAGILQPASYSPVRSTISAMAGQAGTDRWVMTGGIFLTGGCYLVTAGGLTGVRASARALLAVGGLAGIGIAASPEPARGATPRHLAWTMLGRALRFPAHPARAAALSRAELARAGMPDWAVIHRRLARAEVLARYQRQEIRTMVWTVNADGDLARWVAAPGVDALVTDRPAADGVPGQGPVVAVAGRLSG